MDGGGDGRDAADVERGGEEEGGGVGRGVHGGGGVRRERVLCVRGGRVVLDGASISGVLLLEYGLEWARGGSEIRVGAGGGGRGWWW